MLNEIINIDLHIHSVASAYKEAPGVVEDSNVGNVDTLLTALADKQIDLFSITDHNRFDAGLYRALYHRLSEDDCSCNAKLLAGVEFDVRFEDDKPACHVIVIFNACKDEDLDSIEHAINSDLLETASEAYTLSRFESVLKTIKLDTILIAHQHTGLGGTPKKRSLTASSDEAVGLYSFGYIDALEYNKPIVQGILRSELTQLRLPSRMLIGSDCHDWTVYPKHDKCATSENPFFARIRALPSFNGLLMALTSPQTRIGLSNYEMRQGYVKSIEICGKTVPLSAGINVIIGENGIGKSSLLYLISGKKVKSPWINRMKKDLAFSCDSLPVHEPAFIEQGKLQKAYGNDDGIFESSLFEEVDHQAFEDALGKYSSMLKSRIARNIQREKKLSQIQDAAFCVKPELEGATYSFTVSCPEDFAEVTNKWKTPATSLGSIVTKLDAEMSRKQIYSDEELELLGKAKSLVEQVYTRVNNDSESLILQATVKSVIANAINSYKAETSARSSDEDRQKMEYRAKRTNFINDVIWLARDACDSHKPIETIALPDKSGVSINTTRGFKFVQRAKYADSESLTDDFIQCFNTDFRDASKLVAIKSEEDAKKAIPRCSEKWEQSFDALVSKFSDEQKKTARTILEVDNTTTGNTLGEMALSYYKFMSFSQDTASIFMADQPEDNISNNRVNAHLTKYFNGLRAKSQVILVTHSPLLVVNQDADNIIVLKHKSSGGYDVCSGCLESEDMGVIIKEVANIMDGGKEAILRRVKAYGTID